MRQRCGERFEPHGPMDLVPYLRSTAEDGAKLCCVPDPGAPTGARWATLATAIINPNERPCGSRRGRRRQPDRTPGAC